MNAIEKIRVKASTLTLGLIWITVALAIARAAYGTEANSIILVVGALAIGLTATMAWRLDATGLNTRLISGITQAMGVALLVYGFTGSALQVDLHMYFFAALGVTAAWIDWRPIIAFTGVTAVHHLALYVFVPLAVFPGESDLSRVALHAAILLVEAFALIHISRIVNLSFASSQEALNEAEEAREAAANLMQENAATRDAAEAEKEKQHILEMDRVNEVNQVIETLGNVLSRLSDGDLSTRIDGSFHEDFDRVRSDFNRSVDKLSEMVADLKFTSEALAGHSSEIGDATVSLSQRTVSSISLVISPTVGTLSS